MTLLPDFYHVQHITSLSDNRYIAEISLNPAHPIFDGHFPDNPVAPGVCMMQILKELMEEIVQKTLFLVYASSVKFTALINPNENPVLHFEFEISYDEQEQVRVKSIMTFADTIALKLAVTYRASLSR
ncbi:hotdog family protein [Sphingobacterium haloxyli]|uniref:3-hydroxyacyl-ACP dehydratase n=1 Tax=Sphingobacterium haloxyli TaxID=2100533 RepID=A0A2S9J7Y3_9SPHI|nr:3-hydroxyacyl-ACP dehydratase [Sphingobacterium haloxyli]PRD48906.1 3-hydroxyacyl-ACP dehydratase [Sphingobacterium haloxyli]